MPRLLFNLGQGNYFNFLDDVWNLRFIVLIQLTLEYNARNSRIIILNFTKGGLISKRVVNVIWLSQI